MKDIRPVRFLVVKLKAVMCKRHLGEHVSVSKRCAHISCVTLFTHVNMRYAVDSSRGRVP